MGEFFKNPIACLTLASFLITNTGDVARRHMKDPELLRFIDAECFIWSTVNADLTPMINAGMVFCDRHFGGINYPVGGVGRIAEEMAAGALCWLAAVCCCVEREPGALRCCLYSPPPPAASLTHTHSLALVASPSPLARHRGARRPRRLQGQRQRNRHRGGGAAGPDARGPASPNLPRLAVRVWRSAFGVVPATKSPAWNRTFEGSGPAARGQHTLVFYIVLENPN